MKTVKTFIDELGGTSAVARSLGLAPTTVSSWKTAGTIPKWRMRGIHEVAAQRGVPVPDSFAPQTATKPHKF